MRQVASVIKDGRVTYYVVDAEEGELVEFATLAVPDRFDAEAAVKLGFNLVGALRLNGVAGGLRPRHVITPEQARPALPSGEEWTGTSSAVAYIRDHPGCTISDIAAHFGAGEKAVASAVTRGTARHQIERRNGKLFAYGGKPVVNRRPVERKKKWAITREEIVDYIGAHPGCNVKAIATDLMGGVTKETRQVIGNRIMAAMASGFGGIVKEVDDYGSVTYRIEEDDAPTGVRKSGVE